jgi:pheromone shutdown protein TraB
MDEKELELERKITDLEIKEEKAEAQKKLAWAAMLSMVLFTGALFTGFIADNRVDALSDLLGLFFIAQAGVVGAYMGVTAWMSKK